MCYTESDIETAFCEFVKTDEHMRKFYSVVGRQIALPFGILDVLLRGSDSRGLSIQVVEIKKGTIDLKACGQLLGYVEQIDYISGMRNAARLMAWSKDFSVNVNGILVGAEIDKMAYRVCASYGFSFYSYRISDNAIHFSKFNESIDEDAPLDIRLSRLIDEVVDDCFKKFLRMMTSTSDLDPEFTPSLSDTVSIWQSKN